MVGKRHNIYFKNINYMKSARYHNIIAAHTTTTTTRTGARAGARSAPGSWLVAPTQSGGARRSDKTLAYRKPQKPQSSEEKRYDFSEILNRDGL